MTHLLTWLADNWADYLDHHRSAPIIITTAGIIGPIPPEWHNQPNTP